MTVVHVLAEGEHLLSDFAPELVVVEIAGLILVAATEVRRRALFGAVTRDSEQRGDESFLEIRKTKILRDAGDGGAQLPGEIDAGFALEFLAPVVAVEDALVGGRQGEEVFAVEARGAAGEARVELVEVVGAGDHEDAVVVLEAVDFVEEVGPAAGRDDGVDVFEDEHAGGHVAGLDEDGADVPGSRSGFDVEGGNGSGLDFGEGVH